MTDVMPYDDQHSATTVSRPDPTGGRLVAWAQAASAAHQLATSLVKTTFVPKSFAGNPDDATAAIILGDELGLSPLSALRSIYVIGGTPALYARTMVALVLAHGHQIWTEDESDTKVTVCGRRRGTDHVERVTWTVARAQKAKYTNNPKYTTDPIAMLYARASGDVARRIAPDVLAGVPYSIEEIELTEPTTTTRVTRIEGTQKVARKQPEPEPEPEPVVPVHDATNGHQDPASDEPDPITAAQLKKLHTMLTKQGITDREDGLAFYQTVLDRQVESSKALTKAEANLIIDALERAEQADTDDVPEPALDSWPT